MEELTSIATSLSEDISMTACIDSFCLHGVSTFCNSIIVTTTILPWSSWHDEQSKPFTVDVVTFKSLRVCVFAFELSDHVKSRDNSWHPEDLKFR